MKKVKLVDLFNVKYDEMEEKINSELSRVQEGGKTIHEVKFIGEALNKCAVFIVYEE